MKMKKTSQSSGFGPLADGGRVVVVGGGPAGAAAAIAIHEGARSLGRNATVMVVEGKQFDNEKHHNQCAGVLSPPVMDVMEHDLGVPFPHSLTQRQITGYILHSDQQTIILDGKSEPSVALRRIQFDAYMLEAMRQRGIEVYTSRTTGLEFHDDQVIVYTDSAHLEADVVIGAFGLDEGTGVVFQRAVGYQPPPALSSIVTKYHPDPEEVQHFGNRIHAFLPRARRIEFGGVTPKGNHLTINIAGKTVGTGLMDAFLSMPEVQRALPGFEKAGHTNIRDMQYFKGHFPCGIAHRYTGDRFVMVGDAAGLVRAFKGKGITSAIQTGMRAAQVILTQGFSGAAFKAYHIANREITNDLPFGQAMRHLTVSASRLGLMGVVIRAAENAPGLRQALFDAVSAHRSYWQVVRECITINTVQAILSALVQRPDAR